MRQTRYIYYSLATKERYFSFTDIAEEFGVGKGVVAGKFYRAMKKGKSVISLDGTKIIRIKNTRRPTLWYDK